VADESRDAPERTDIHRVELVAVFGPQVLDRLSRQRCDDRRDQHGLRDDHRLRCEQEAPGSERARARQEKVDEKPDHDRRQPHEGVEYDDDGLPPRKRTSARKAPKGTPMRAARSTAERLTMRDSRTIAISAGSAVSTSWSAETSVGMKNPAFLDFLQTTLLWSNLHLGSYVCMPDLLTTDEAAIYLRLSPRKLYELLAKGAVPCTKVTGRWLF